MMMSMLLMTSMLAWQSFNPDPDVSRNRHRFEFIHKIKQQRERGAVVLEATFGRQSKGSHCPVFELEAVEALVGTKPDIAPLGKVCDESRETGKREVFVVVRDSVTPSAVYFSYEYELPSLAERRRMVIQAVELLDAGSDVEFLQLGREALADGFPHVLSGLVSLSRERLHHATAEDRDGLATLILDLLEAKARTDVGCATELQRTFDVLHVSEPRYPGISEATQSRAEAMYAALPEAARNPRRPKPRPISKQWREATK
ncbi:MAG: hypothetical protein AAF219_10740, partial [Myxococcota bacterium]